MKLSTKFNTIEQSAAELYYGDDLEHVLHVALAYADMLCHAVTFDLWSLDLELLQHFECHVFKLCTQFERNWIIHGWVIDDLARFRRAILGVGYDGQTVLRGAWTQLHQTWQRHRAIIRTQEICFRVQISCCVFKCGRLKAEWCWKRRQIFLWKLGERGTRSLYQLL